MTFDNEKRDAAISALYRYFMGSGANQIAVSEVRIKHVFSDAIGAPFAAAMFGELVKFELLRRSDAVELHLKEGSAYEATAEFFRMAQSIENSTPASDRFVSLDHNSEPYKQAVSSLDDVVKVFRDDKTKDNELGQEKAVLLRMLEAGREYLNDTKVRVQTVVSSIVEPLKIIAAKYDQAVVGAAAAKALDLIVELLQQFP